MLMAAKEAWDVLRDADEVFSAEVVTQAVERVAQQISAVLADKAPMVLSVMGGAVVFSGRILPMLHFPLDFETIHVTRYGDRTTGGRIEWKVAPRETVAGRTVLVLDDILDEGHTLAAIKDALMSLGAAHFYSAVLADKDIGRSKPVAADFVGLTVPDRYVFGCGMDVRGAWRNLPAIYALKEHRS